MCYGCLRLVLIMDCTAARVSAQYSVPKVNKAAGTAVKAIQFKSKRTRGQKENSFKAGDT